MVLTSDGGLVSGSWNRFVKKWDGEAGTEVWSRSVGARISCVSELNDGRLVVSGYDGSVWILDRVTGDEIMVCRGHVGSVLSVLSLGDLGAGSFASGSIDGTVRVWASDGTLVRVVEVGILFRNFSLSHFRHFAAACSADVFVRLYRLPDWEQVWSVKAHVDEVWSVSWSPDGRFLASGSVDRTVKILSADTGTTLRTLRGHTYFIYSVAWTDSTKVLSGSNDRTVRVWRIFWPMERRVRALCAGLVVDDRTDFDRDGLREVVWRTKRLWEVEPKEEGDGDVRRARRTRRVRG